MHLAADPAARLFVQVGRYQVLFVIGAGADVFTAEQVDLVLSCHTCGELHDKAPSDIPLLIDCAHMPFEKRVAFTLGVQQAPREGELACMRWERIDLDAGGWWIAESWRDGTKNGPTNTAGYRAGWWERCAVSTRGPVARRSRTPPCERFARL